MLSSSKYYVRPVVPEDRTDPESRVVIDNIPPGVTEVMLRRRLSVHGDAHVHVFVPGCQYAKGWAWVSFEEKAATQQLVQNAQSKIKENVEITAPSEQHISISTFNTEEEKTEKRQTEEEERKAEKVHVSGVVVSEPIKKHDYEEDKNNNLSTAYNTEESNLDEASSSSPESRTGSCADSGDEIQKKNDTEFLHSDDDNDNIIINSNNNDNCNNNNESNNNNNENNNNNNSNKECIKRQQTEEENEEENVDFPDDSSADESLVEDEMSD